MTRRYWPLILVLAAVWGASYLFIKVGVEGGLSPGALMFARTLIAGGVLLAYLMATLGARTALRRLREAWRQAIVLGVLNAAAPFWLIAWGEKYIDSGLAGIAQATVPIFSLLIGLRFLPHERIGAARVAGVCLGLVGVAFVAGGAPEGDAWAVAGTLAVVLASVFYAGAGIYGQLNVHETPGPVLATGCMLAASVFLFPLALASPPTSVPTTGAIASLLLLALFGTALAQLVLFRVVRLYGARRLSLVTYLLPGFALVYGAVILDERVGASALVGLALILAGVALGSGTLRLRRRAAAAVTSSRLDEDANRRRRRAAAADELDRLVQVHVAVECEHERVVAVEAGCEELLDPPAEDLRDRVRAAFLGDVGGGLDRAHATLRSDMLSRFCSSTYRAVA